MKANRRSAPLSIVAAAALSILACSCSDNRVIPPPTPSPTPRPAPTPPPPPPRTSGDWRDAPITPGDWSWETEGGKSVARFAGGALTLRCDRASGTVTLLRAGTAGGPVPLTITATSGVRTLSATPQGANGLAVALTARDPVLDSMIFSRGRFAVEAPGLAPLYVPSWPEIARVAEDCR